MIIEQIKEEITKENGWISFDRFMFLALYRGNGSFYNREVTDKRNFPIGRSGDFITHSSLGFWMAKAYAKAFVTLYSKCNPKTELCIREYGPGSGELAALILIELFNQKIMPVRYEMIEISSFFKEKQKSNIEKIIGSYNRELLPKIKNIFEWKKIHVEYDDFHASTELKPITGLIIVNEIIDAFPVKVGLWQQNSPIFELGVSKDEINQLTLAFREASFELKTRINQRKTQSENLGNYWNKSRMIDVCCYTENWLEKMTKTFVGGQILISDYGMERIELDHADRIESTVTGFRQHEQIHKLIECIQTPGEIDLTHKIDFSQITDFFNIQTNVDISLKTQAAWLIDSGIMDDLEKYIATDAGDVDFNKNIKYLQKLLLDNEMGQVFLVFSVIKGF